MEMLTIVREQGVVIAASTTIVLVVVFLKDLLVRKFGKKKDYPNVLIENQKLLKAIRGSAVKTRKKKLREMQAQNKKKGRK